VLAAQHGLQGHLLTAGQVDGGGLFDVRVDGANAHIQTGHVKDTLQLNHIAQIEGVAGVVLGNDEQVFGFGADFLDGRLGSLHRQRQHFGRQIVPATRKQIGVDRCQLEAGIANVHRGVNRRRVLHPFKAKPALNGGHGIEHALLEFVDGAIQGCD